MHRIEEELGAKAQFAGKNFRNPLTETTVVTIRTTYPSTVNVLIVQFESVAIQQKAVCVITKVWVVTGTVSSSIQKQAS